MRAELALQRSNMSYLAWCILWRCSGQSGCAMKLCKSKDDMASSERAVSPGLQGMANLLAFSSNRRGM